MPKLPSGVYDLPVTVELERALAALDPSRWASTREAPDSADSHELLAWHIANLVRQILQTVPEEERTPRPHPGSSAGVLRPPKRDQGRAADHD
jgi:hypothetical protein